VTAAIIHRIFIYPGRHPRTTLMDVKNYKVVLLGEGAVGKTSLFLRWTTNQFFDDHRSTKQACHSEKRVNLPSGARVDITLWDTAGQEKYHALLPNYYREADAAILVYDLTSLESLHRVKNWVKELRRIVGEKITLFMVGNKSDLQRQQAISRADAQEYANQVGAKHYFTSCKLNQGINEMFLDLTKTLAESAGGPKGQRNPSKKGVKIIKDDDPPPVTGCCK